MKSPAQAAPATVGWVDDRLGTANFFRRTMTKVFPDHWSFMLGEIALYSFVILVLTGTYLALFYVDSDKTVIYHGAYVPMRGVSMSEAFASTLNISFGVKAGLVIRQMHHWAALLFVAAIIVHLCRVFFTGAYRKPREINWLIGVTLLVLAIAEDFAGYSLPGDLLSGTGVRIAYSILESIPVIGTWLAFIVFDGPFPGHDFLGRLYIVHVFIVPALLAGVIGAHMAILWHQKHTQFPGPGRTEHNVVGERFFPAYMAKAGGFFMLVFAVLGLLGGLAQINPIWLYGPYHPYLIAGGSQPDWPLGFLDGAMRLMPNWEFASFGHTIPFNIFIPAIVLPGILFTAMALYPFLEAHYTGDHDFHNLLDRPRDHPVRTGIGMMSLSFYTILLLASATDVEASIFKVSEDALIWAGRIGLFIVPPLVYKFTKVLCENLQSSDREQAEHGYETGMIQRLPNGEYIELHAPLPERPAPELTPVNDGHTNLEEYTTAATDERDPATLSSEGAGRPMPPGP